jgi:hypothetical protein
MHSVAYWRLKVPPSGTMVFNHDIEKPHGHDLLLQLYVQRPAVR